MPNVEWADISRLYGFQLYIVGIGNTKRNYGTNLKALYFGNNKEA